MIVKCNFNYNISCLYHNTDLISNFDRYRELFYILTLEFWRSILFTGIVFSLIMIIKDCIDYIEYILYEHDRMEYLGSLQKQELKTILEEMQAWTQKEVEILEENIRVCSQAKQLKLNQEELELKKQILPLIDKLKDKIEALETNFIIDKIIYNPILFDAFKDYLYSSLLQNNGISKNYILLFSKHVYTINPFRKKTIKLISNYISTQVNRKFTNDMEAMIILRKYDKCSIKIILNHMNAVLSTVNYMMTGFISLYVLMLNVNPYVFGFIEVLNSNVDLFKIDVLTDFYESIPQLLSLLFFMHYFVLELIVFVGKFSMWKYKYKDFMSLSIKVWVFLTLFVIICSEIKVFSTYSMLDIYTDFSYNIQLAKKYQYSIYQLMDASRRSEPGDIVTIIGISLTIFVIYFCVYILFFMDFTSYFLGLVDCKVTGLYGVVKKLDVDEKTKKNIISSVAWCIISLIVAFFTQIISVGWRALCNWNHLISIQDFLYRFDIYSMIIKTPEEIKNTQTINRIDKLEVNIDKYILFSLPDVVNPTNEIKAFMSSFMSAMMYGDNDKMWKMAKECPDLYLKNILIEELNRHENIIFENMHLIIEDRCIQFALSDKIIKIFFDEGLLINIAGESGSGKSQLLNKLFLKSNHIGVKVNNIPSVFISDSSKYLMPLFTPDDSYFCGYLTLEENFKIANPEFDIQTSDVLDKSNMSAYKNKMHRMFRMIPFSTGQRARIEANHTLVAAERLVNLDGLKLVGFDELFANLDSVSRSKMSNLLMETIRKVGAIGFGVDHSYELLKGSKVQLFMNLEKKCIDILVIDGKGEWVNVKTLDDGKYVNNGLCIVVESI